MQDEQMAMYDAAIASEMERRHRTAAPGGGELARRALCQVVRPRDPYRPAVAAFEQVVIRLGWALEHFEPARPRGPASDVMIPVVGWWPPKRIISQSPTRHPAMFRTLSIVVSVGLADSVNASTIGPALFLAGGDHPRWSVLEFTLGIVAVFFLGGALLVLGPGRALLALLPHPSQTARYIVETVVGAVMLVGAVVLWTRRRSLSRKTGEDRKRREAGGQGGDSGQQGPSSATIAAAGCGCLASATLCPAHSDSASISPVVPTIGARGMSKDRFAGSEVRYYFALSRSTTRCRPARWWRGPLFIDRSGTLIVGALSRVPSDSLPCCGCPEGEDRGRRRYDCDHGRRRRRGPDRN
jgi:Sap, sulfolipid-1-addressing protein